jgi:hypothetical protein
MRYIYPSDISSTSLSWAAFPTKLTSLSRPFTYHVNTHIVKLRATQFPGTYLSPSPFDPPIVHNNYNVNLPGGIPFQRKRRQNDNRPHTLTVRNNKPQLG